MDQWNDGQRPDVSVSGQFEGVPGQDQAQNSYAGGCGQPQNNGYAGGYGQPQNSYAGAYGQPYGGYGMPPCQKPGYAQAEMEEPVGVGEWIVLLAIATFVPFVGLILVLVWALSGQGKKSRSNFCKAYLLIALIKLVLYAVLIIAGISLSAAAPYGGF